MEPYHPYIRPESNAEPLSDDTAGDGSRRMSSNPRASMDGTTIPQRRKSIFPGPITLEIPSTSPRNSISSSQMDRRKSVLDLWTSQSAVQLRNMHDRRRSCLSDFSASRRESFFLHRRESYFSAQPTKLSPMSCHYNSNRSVSLHPYFYLNSKTPPTLRYTPASTEKSDKSSLSPPPLMDILPNYTSPIQNYPLEGEVVTRIQIHDEKDSLSNSSDQYYHQVNSKVMNRRYSINGLEDDEGDIQNEEEERDEVSVAYSHSDTRSSKVSEV
uniref:Uncharacterized protein n=1 Tax=Lepeophtheirus salmonis TaxID=72036 RepID=A0A0K2TYW4_LEPSM